MRLLSYLFLLTALAGFILCIIAKLFYPDGVHGVGLGSFYSVTLLSTLLVIAISLMRTASKD